MLIYVMPAPKRTHICIYCMYNIYIFIVHVCNKYICASFWHSIYLHNYTKYQWKLYMTSCMCIFMLVNFIIAQVFISKLIHCLFTVWKLARVLSFMLLQTFLFRELNQKCYIIQSAVACISHVSPLFFPWKMNNQGH